MSSDNSVTDVKTDFYTREGLWMLLPSLDYVKLPSSTQNNQYNTTTSNSSQLAITNSNNTNSTINNNGNTMNNNNNNQILTSNEPVKIEFLTINSYKCENCNNRIELANDSRTSSPVETTCTYCNQKFSNSINKSLTEILIFNYCRELYCYKYNGIKQPSDAKNLFDKKAYKSLTVTCHDVNVEAYKKNSSSLLVVVGFNKGEIHVYDAYKKDSSQYFNSSKTIDKTRATCVKWIPKSQNLFLISYSSGNMYLYDINSQQNQSSTSSSSSNQIPHFQSIFEGEGYSIYSNVTKNSKNNTIYNENNGSFKTTNGSTASNGDSNNSISNPSNNNNNPLTRWQLSNFDSHSLPGINEFSFSPCGQYIALACQDGSLRLFDYKEMTLKSFMKSYFGGLLCLSWSQDGRYIATGGEDDLITVFSFHENRVACRCRGHSSWVNSVQFDNWAQSYYDNSRINLNSNENDDQDSDFEEYHNKIANGNNLNIKKRTLSTSSNFSRQHSLGLSNKRMSSLSDYEQLFNSSKSIFYRLGSVGQDNKIAFWDLTEDVLKEKIHSRSRVTSIIVSNPVNQIDEKQFQYDNSKHSNEENNILSALTNNSSSSSNGGVVINTSNTGSVSSSFSFLKKAKRNTAANSNKNNSINKVSQTSNNTANNNKASLQQKFSYLNITNVLCPKLDEVPIIEPLICKRIAHERLTSLIFKEDSFLVASQNGVVNTWARPGKTIGAPSAIPSNQNDDQIQASTFL